MGEDRNLDVEDVVFLDVDPPDRDVETPGGSDDADLATRLEEACAEAAEYKEQYLRKLADFENYRRRQEREMAEFRRMAHSDLLKECLPVLDNLERALEVSDESAAGLRDGVHLVLRQLKEVLARFGLQEIPALSGPFDPTIHEGVQRQPVPGIDEPTVVQVLVKGYQLNERLLRPAMVVVGMPTAHAGEGGKGDHEQDHRD